MSYRAHTLYLSFDLPPGDYTFFTGTKACKTLPLTLETFISPVTSAVFVMVDGRIGT